MIRTCPGCGFDLPEGSRHHHCAVCGVLRLTTLRCICIEPVRDRCYNGTWTCRACGSPMLPAPAEEAA
jgi:hypothetical protein